MEGKLGVIQKYPNGTKFKTWKYFDWNDKPIEGNYLVDCEVTGVCYYNNPTLGTVYDAIAKEEVQCGDANWNKSMSVNTGTSDKELDEYFSNS